MLSLLEHQRQAIETLCRKHDVKRLELFGSAARGEASAVDLDFFVEFADYSAPTIADQWFGLQEDLQALLGRKIDLVSPRQITNPFFLASANRDRVTLYAAA